MSIEPLPPTKQPLPKRAARAVFVYACVPYIAIAVLAGVFQRRLMYQPVRTEKLEAADSGLPESMVRSISVKADDELELHGWHIFPDGQSAEDVATADWLVLYFHGNAGNRKSRAPDCRDFTNLGCHVLLFDYRGYGENEGSPSESAFVSDAQAIHSFAINTLSVPHDHILIYGESLGGGVAAQLAAHACESGAPPGALVLNATFSSMVDAASSVYPFLPVSLLLIDRYPSADRIQSVTCPVLQIHGTRDEIVPFELGQKLFKAIPHESSTGIAKRFVEMDGYGHNNLPVSTFKGHVASFLGAVQPTNKSLPRE